MDGRGKSIENYKKSAELNKSSFESIVLQGWAYRIEGKYEEALNEYSELLKHDVPAIWQFEGKMISSYTYAEQGQYNKAIKLMREAIRISAQFDEQRVIIGMKGLSIFYSISGDTAMAFSILDSALAMNPAIDAERDIYKYKGFLHAGSGNQEKILELINILNKPEKQISVILSWGVPDILNIELLRLQGDADKALINYDKLGMYKYVLNFDLKIRLYAAAHDWENVILTAKDMRSSTLFGEELVDRRFHDYPRSFYFSGIAYEEMGKPKLAIENYEALLDLWKDADEEIPERRYIML